MKESGKQKLELLRRRFGEWLGACNYAVRTREEYDRSVRDFLAWLAEETEIESIAEAMPQHLHQYQLALCQRPAKDEGRILAVSTQAKTLAAIKTWFEWMVSEQLLAFNPASALQMPKVPRSLPRDVLTLEEVRPRWASEAGRTVLFVSSRSGRALSDNDLLRIVRKAAKRAGIRKHITPHTLRHSCATHLLQEQADIRQIQKLLGHRKLSTTEIYTRVEIGDLAGVIARCHPREKVRREPEGSDDAGKSE